MNTPPRISVALCTCNGERFLPPQLASIAAQSRAVDELIACDDFSSDRTVDLLRSFAQTVKFPVKIQVNEKRLGVTGNFEQAVRMCSGDFIFLADQDDVWHPEKVRRLADRLADPMRKVGLVFSNGQVVDESDRLIGQKLWEAVWFDADQQQLVRKGRALDVLLRHPIAAGTSLAFAAEYLPLLLPFPDVKESHDIWITLLISCVARIVAIDDDLIQYRLHDANQVGMKRIGLLQQIRQAPKRTRAEVFGDTAALHEAAWKRLAESGVDPRTVSIARRKAEHTRVRRDLPCGWPARLAAIGTELSSGNYARFSLGYLSLFRDLLLR